MKVAVLGRTRMLYDTIDELIASGHEIVLVGTCPAAPEYDITEADFQSKAKDLNIPFFNNVRINSPEVISVMKEAHADIAVSVNWITVIKGEACSCFKYGILNAHCGDLPRYKGNATPNWSILNNESYYAISIHYMEPDSLDSGNIVLKKCYSISEQTTVTEIYANMNESIPKLFSKAVNIIEQNEYTGEEQSKNVVDSLRCYPRIPTDSFIDWSWSCDRILRMIRASARPFSGAFTYYGTTKIFIYKAQKGIYEMPCLVIPGQVVKVDKIRHLVEIAAGDGVIVLKKVTIDGKEVNADRVLKSIRIRLNYCLHEEIYQLRKQVEYLTKIIEGITGDGKEEK
jgi:methionyl-tRNA formyltransferase